MLRGRHLITAATACLAAFSCTESSDEEVNRQILYSTIWYGEISEPAAASEELNQISATEATYLYIFGSDGVMTVYPQKDEDLDGPPLKRLLYIYTPKASEMVIENYGLFTVKEISVERLLLEGIGGKMDLRFYGQRETVPPTANRHMKGQLSQGTRLSE